MIFIPYYKKTQAYTPTELGINYIYTLAYIPRQSGIYTQTVRHILHPYSDINQERDLKAPPPQFGEPRLPSGGYSFAYISRQIHISHIHTQACIVYLDSQIYHTSLLRHIYLDNQTYFTFILRHVYLDSWNIIHPDSGHI